MGPCAERHHNALSYGKSAIDTPRTFGHRVEVDAARRYAKDTVTPIAEQPGAPVIADLVRQG